jgi:hypothetical protein
MSMTSPALVGSEARRLRVVRELSDTLGCGLDDETLRILMELLDLGVEPQALARIVLELKDQQWRAENATRITSREKKRSWANN